MWFDDTDGAKRDLWLQWNIDCVKIYEYSPGFLHGKSFVGDDKIADVGTINLDFRSLYMHFKCGTLLVGTDTVMALKEDVETILPQCREVHLEDCSRGFFEDIFGAVVRVIAPLM